MASTTYEFAQDLKKEYGALVTVASVMHFTKLNRRTVQKKLAQCGVLATNPYEHKKLYFYKDVAAAMTGRQVSHV